MAANVSGESFVSKAIPVRNNGTFRWTEQKDGILLTEVRFVEPYSFKQGSKEAGKAWNEVANGVNQHEGFKEMPRDQRSVRERFNKLLADFRSKMRKEEAESGTNPDKLTVMEILLEEIAEKIASSKTDVASGSASENQKMERQKAVAIREMAMKTWSKSAKIGGDDSGEDESEKDDQSKPGRGRKRKRGSDAFQYLEIKGAADAEVKKEEFALRREELAVQQKQAELQQQRQEQFQKQMLHQQDQLHQQAMQQQQQYNLQQQQMQQQMQAQQQTQNIMLALFQKMTKGD